MTPPIDCSPASTTTPINFHRNKLYWRQLSANRDKSAISPAVEVGHGRRSRTRPPMVSLEPPWKVASVGTLHILIRGPWGRQNYFKPKQRHLVLATSGASDEDEWGAYGCNFSWRFQWHHRRPCPTSAAVSDIGGRVRHRQPCPTWRPEISPICHLQLSPILGSSPPPWRPCSCHRQ